MARVIVIGGANVDIKGRSSGAFIGGTSNPGDVTVSVGGVGRNIAENLARLGHGVSLLTVLGEDANGRLVRESCAAANVELGLTVTSRLATGTYLVVLDRKGELISAINDMQAIESLTPAQLDRVSARLREADMLVADCNIPAACLDWLCRFSAESGIRLAVEPVSVPKARKLLSFTRIQPVFAITPNLQQIAAMTGEANEARAIAKLHLLGFANVVMHQGGKGALVSSGSGIIEVPPFLVADVADVTGAGDAAVAGLLCGILDGMPLESAARIGQAAASMKLSSRESAASSMTRQALFHLAGIS